MKKSIIPLLAALMTLASACACAFSTPSRLIFSSKLCKSSDMDSPPNLEDDYTAFFVGKSIGNWFLAALANTPKKHAFDGRAQ